MLNQLSFHSDPCKVMDNDGNPFIPTMAFGQQAKINTKKEAHNV